MNSKSVYSLLAVALGAVGYYVLADYSPAELETTTSAVASSSETSPSIARRTESDDISYESQLLEISRTLREVQGNLDKFKSSLTQELDALKLSLGTVDTAPFIAETEPALSEEDIAGDDRSEQEKEVTANAWYEDRVNAFETVLRAEEPDQQWADQTEQRFLSVLDRQDKSFELHAMTCGDSVCKVDAGFATEGSNVGPDIDHLVYGELGWEGQVFSKVNADTGEITIYLMRPGMEIPDVDSEG